MMDLISIIVPVFNVENYLEKCVTSLITQTYGNLEIILVDDGSTDGSPALCDRFAKEDNRIRCIHKPNSGQSDARNVGVQESRGSYIMFVDSDDYIAADMVEKLWRKIVENKADISLCAMFYVAADGSDCYEPKPFCDEVLTGKEVLSTKLNLNNPKWEYWGALWAKLYRRKLVVEVPFPKGKLFEDQYTAHHFYGRSEIVATIPDALYFYVQRDGSTVHPKNTITKLSNHIDYTEAYLNRAKYLMQNEIRESARAYFYKVLDMVDAANYEITSKKIENEEIKNKYRDILHELRTLYMRYFFNLGRLSKEKYAILFPAFFKTVYDFKRKGRNFLH